MIYCIYANLLLLWYNKIDWGVNMKILLILTGGTIGSKENDENINIHDSIKSELLKHYNSNYKNNIKFEVINPINILSENVTYKFWNILVDSLYKVDFSKYDGIIITHGSDTLSYTSALLGFLFAHAKVPLVLTASDYPLQNPISNGVTNFNAAIEFIKEKINGVFVSYGSRECTKIYLATRIISSDPYNDLFRDFTGVPFAEYFENRFIFLKGNAQPDCFELNKKRKKLLQLPPKFTNDVLLLQAYPNQNYNHLDLTQKPKAVLHYLYHSATVCTDGTSTSSYDFFKKCIENEIPIYLASFKNKEKHYASFDKINNLPINKMANISLESAYAKLCLAFNQTEKEPQEIIDKNIFFEYI